MVPSEVNSKICTTCTYYTKVPHNDPVLDQPILVNWHPVLGENRQRRTRLIAILRPKSRIYNGELSISPAVCGLSRVCVSECAQIAFLLDVEP